MKQEGTFEKHIEALTRISRAITSDRYIEDILRLIVTVTAETMHSKICALWLLDKGDDTFKLRATQSISEDYLKTERTRKRHIDDTSWNIRPGSLPVDSKAEYGRM